MKERKEVKMFRKFHPLSNAQDKITLWVHKLAQNLILDTSCIKFNKFSIMNICKLHTWVSLPYSNSYFLAGNFKEILLLDQLSRRVKVKGGASKVTVSIEFKKCQCFRQISSEKEQQLFLLIWMEFFMQSNFL